jgi:hypothetical protein
MPYSSYQSPNSQSFGAIQNQSFNGMGPGWWNNPYADPNAHLTDPNAGFNARNYGAPRQATQPAPVTPAAGPAPSQPQSPQFDVSSLAAALSQQIAPAPNGLGTYQTGIEHGTLSNQSIANSMKPLAFTGGQMPTASGVPVSSQAASGLNRQWNDLMAQGASGASGDLQRDAAYQQGQMGLSQSKAKTGAMMGGFKIMQNQWQDNLENQLAQRGMRTSLLGSLLGYM